MAYKINHANIKDWAKNYDGPLFDGILCDPPYHLTSMSKPRTDLEDYDNGKGNPYARRQAAMKGFMGKEWDGVDENGIGIAQDPEMWRLLYNLLKPGAHLLAFSGSRTYHRMAVAIEDAGFEIRDMIEWVYGSGFPKSLNIGKAVDKIQGNEREVVGKYVAPDGKERGGVANNPMNIANYQKGDRSEHNLTKGTSEWEGYGTSLKPSHEPCVLARKPISEKNIALNVLKHGTGGLNIDQCRVPTSEDISGISSSSSIWSVDGTAKNVKSDGRELGGRFPANLILSDDPEVEAVFPQTTSGGGNKNSKDTSNSFLGTGHGGIGTKTDWTINTGSASRFFYCAKSSRAERNSGLDTPNTHPTLKPLSLTKYLATLIKPPTGGRLLVPFSGSGSEMIGALQAGWEYVEGVELTEEYIPIAEARIKYWTSKP